MRGRGGTRSTIHHGGSQYIGKVTAETKLMEEIRTDLLAWWTEKMADQQEAEVKRLF